MKVLVVGGAGYVGGNLVDRLMSDKKINVRVFDNLLYEDAYLKDVDFFFGDVSNMDELSAHLEWAEYVIWLAAVVGDPACALDPARTMRVNTQVLQEVAEQFQGRFIFPSTCSVYGAAEGLLTEESPFNPQSLYAESKIQAEEIVKKMPNSIIFRLGTLFGVSDQHARIRSDLVLNVLTIRATSEGLMTVFGGKQSRPLLHVRDAGKTMHEALNHDVCGIFNLHGENLTILELADRIQKEIPGTIMKISESAFEDTRNYSVSSAKAQEQIGFRTEYAVEDGIREIHHLAESRRVPNFNLSRFSNVRALEEKS